MLANHSRNSSQQLHLETHKKHAKAERVRKLWSEFGLWLKPSRNEMERVRDQLLLQTANLNSNSIKSSRRRIEEAHFSKAREEWQRRLRTADLKESDWDPMNEAEMKAVEETLGVNDEEGYITDPSPSPTHRPPPSSIVIPLVPAENSPNRSSFSLIPGPSSMLIAPPMTSASRATSASSSSYEYVRPEEFHSDDENTSDSEFSFSTTISSIISEEDEVVGPVTEYMFSQALKTDPYIGARPSLEVAKDSNGPLLTRNAPPVAKLVDPGAGAQPTPSSAPRKRPPDAKSSPQSTSSSRSSSTSTSAPVAKKLSPPVPVQSAAPVTTNNSPPAASKASKSSRVHYPLVTPSLSDLSDYDEVENDVEPDRLSPSLIAQFEAQFEVRKLEIRIEKIREFHGLAAEADIALSIQVADGRRDRTLSRQDEADLVQMHYESTVALRDKMEKERKEQVNEEKKRMREEYMRRSSFFHQRRHPPIESDSEDDQEREMQERLERMRQEQLALQAQFGSHEAQATRKRAATLTLGPMPTPIVVMNDKSLDDSEVSTPRPVTKGASAWSSPKTPTTRSLLGQSFSRKPASPPLESVVQQQQHLEAENEQLETDHEDADKERDKENTGLWSYLTSGSRKRVVNAASPQLPQSPWNVSSPVAKSLQKPTNAKSRLGIVTSAWDDDFGADDKEAVEEAAVDKEESSQDKTPVIPSAPAPNVSPINKKQAKKIRQANKKGGAAGVGSSSTTMTKAEKAEVSASSNMQKGSQVKTVPGKSGRKLSESDDILSTPQPGILKRLPQLADEEASNEDETPTTPRPPPVKKAAAAQAPSNPWGRGISKMMNKNVADDVAVDSTPDATSSRPGLDQVNSKRAMEPAALSPQIPGAWVVNAATSNDKGRGPFTTTVAGSRKNNGTARQATVNGVDNTESIKKKGKKPQRGSANVNVSVKTTVEEVPDDEADELHTVLPYNSRSILEEMHAPPLDFEEQPRIHEPKPSKPRAVFENIFQYGEADPGAVHDLQDELSWSDERIAQAVARMTQESAEMERMVNGLNGNNGHLSSSSSMNNGVVGGMSLNGAGAGHVNMADMNRGNMNNVNRSTATVNGFGLSKPAMPVVDVATTMSKKQARWQPQPQPQSQPSNLGGFDDHPRSQLLPPQALVNKMAAVSRSYEDDEAFSSNAGFSGFQSPSSSYVPFSGRNNKMNGVASSGMPQFGGLSGNHHPFGDDEPEGDELERAARSLLENIHVSVSSQQRNKPGFSAV